jgi:hypothetical protein
VVDNYSALDLKSIRIKEEVFLKFYNVTTNLFTKYLNKDLYKSYVSITSTSSKGKGKYESKINQSTIKVPEILKSFCVIESEVDKISNARKFSEIELCSSTQPDSLKNNLKMNIEEDELCESVLLEKSTCSSIYFEEKDKRALRMKLLEEDLICTICEETKSNVMLTCYVSTSPFNSLI